MKHFRDSWPFPVNFPVKAQQKRTKKVVKPGVEPIEAREKRDEGSNPSTGTIHTMENASGCL
jgi:hypothetical protein